MIKGISRRNLLFGAAGVVVGGAVATGVGLGLRSQIKRLLGMEYPAVIAASGALTGNDDGWLLDASERSEFESLDRAAKSEVIEIRDSVETRGDSYAARRVNGLQDCVAECEADPDCRAFTYVRATHPKPAERRMCYLKNTSEIEIVTNASKHVSGFRG